MNVEALEKLVNKGIAVILVDDRMSDAAMRFLFLIINLRDRSSTLVWKIFGGAGSVILIYVLFPRSNSET